MSKEKGWARKEQSHFARRGARALAVSDAATREREKRQQRERKAWKAARRSNHNVDATLAPISRAQLPLIFTGKRFPLSCPPPRWIDRPRINRVPRAQPRFSAALSANNETVTRARRALAVAHCLSSSLPRSLPLSLSSNPDNALFLPEQRTFAPAGLRELLCEFCVTEREIDSENSTRGLAVWGELADGGLPWWSGLNCDVPMRGLGIEEKLGEEWRNLLTDET